MSNFIKEKNIETISKVTNSSNTKKILRKINDLKIQIIFPKEQLSNKNAINCCYMLLNILPRFLNNVSYDGPDMIIKKFPQSHREKISINKIQNPTLTRFSRINEVPVELESGHPHIFSSHNQYIWFCSPGFAEYHMYYKPDRWELIRNTSQGKISWIINRAISLIDRSRLCGYNV